MNMIAQISRVCERKSELVSKVYANIFSCVCLFALTSLIFNTIIPFGITRMLHFISIIGCIGINLYLEAAVNYINPRNAFSLLIAYSVLNGIAFAPIMYVVGSTKVIAGGIITSLLLVASMWVSRNVEIDSNDAKFISIMCITLLGMSIANYFLRLSILEFAICVVGLMVSFGFCAYEIHQMESSNFRGDIQNSSTIISLRVFISIVSIFVYVLRLLYMFSGKNRD